MRLAITAFTTRGAALARTLAQGLGNENNECRVELPARLAKELGEQGYQTLAGWTTRAFSSCEGLIFVGACGIAVRAVAPHVNDKFSDPAVVAVDEGGTFSIPLLSGHAGGANRLARQVAELTGGTAVVSTATDLNGVFAVDDWAIHQGLMMGDRILAKRISASLLAGESVGMFSDFPVTGNLPPQVVQVERDRQETPALGFAITLHPDKAPFQDTLRLTPKILSVGIGCRRGVPEERIALMVDKTLRQFGLSPRAIRAVHTIDLKAQEQGLLDFCRTRGIPLKAHAPQELSQVQGEFSSSEFVRGVAGVDNVCERAAMLGGGSLLVKKQAEQGITVAVAVEDFSLSF